MSEAAGATGRTSAYVRLAHELRDAILRKEFPDGVRLPTEAELARTHGVSRQTVRRAFQDLVAEGMVFRVPGRGTFAARRQERYLRQFGSVDDLMALSSDTRMRVVAPLRRRVDLEAAGRLRLRSDEVHTVTFLRLHEDVPFCLTTVHLPPGVGRLLQDEPQLTTPAATGTATGTATVIGLLDARLSTPIAEAEQSITVGAATSEMARHLGCPVDRPLLRIDRLYRSSDGTPVELAISHFVPEHYSYRVRLKRNL